MVGREDEVSGSAGDSENKYSCWYCVSSLTDKEGNPFTSCGVGFYAYYPDELGSGSEHYENIWDIPYGSRPYSYKFTYNCIPLDKGSNVDLSNITTHIYTKSEAKDMNYYLIVKAGDVEVGIAFLYTSLSSFPDGWFDNFVSQTIKRI